MIAGRRLESRTQSLQPRVRRAAVASAGCHQRRLSRPASARVLGCLSMVPRIPQRLTLASRRTGGAVALVSRCNTS